MARTKQSLKFETEWINEFNSNTKFRSNINSLFKTKFNHATKSPNEYPSTRWQETANKTRKDPSKSDVLLDSFGGVSLKNGPGRATSAKLGETKAIFYSVIENNKKYSGNKSLVQKVDDLFQVWTNVMGGKTQLLTENDITTTEVRMGTVSCPELKKIIDVCDLELNPRVKQIRDDHEDFMLDVIYECLTGTYKFGDSPQKAKYYIRHKKGCLNTIEFAAETDSPEMMQECKKFLSEVNIKMKAGGSSRRGRPHWPRFM